MKIVKHNNKINCHDSELGKWKVSKRSETPRQPSPLHPPVSQRGPLSCIPCRPVHPFLLVWPNMYVPSARHCSVLPHVTLIKMASLCMDLSLNIVSRFACIDVCARSSLVSLMYGISSYEYITLCIHPPLHKYELFPVFVLCGGFVCSYKRSCTRPWWPAQEGFWSIFRTGNCWPVGPVLVQLNKMVQVVLEHGGDRFHASSGV